MAKRRSNLDELRELRTDMAMNRQSVLHPITKVNVGGVSVKAPKVPAMPKTSPAAMSFTKIKWLDIDGRPSGMISTITNDTNVTGTVVNTDLQLGWAGQLAVSRGGTGLGTWTQYGIVYASAAGTLGQIGLGSTTQVLHGNATGSPTFGSVVESDISLSDNTSNNVSISAHGFAPKLPNTTDKFLDGKGNYSLPLTIYNVKAYGAVGDSTNGVDGTDDTAAIASAYAACSSGIMYFPPGGYRVTASLDPKSNVSIQGSGNGVSTIFYAGTGYWLDHNSTSSLSDFSIENLKITCIGSAIGGVRLGNTNTATHPFSENSWRYRFVFKNLLILGTGEANAGTIGMSITQAAEGRFDHIDIRAFETCLIMDRTTVCLLTRIRLQNFLNGALWERQDATGNSRDTAVMLDILGPTIGSGGYGVKMNADGVRFISPYYEFTKPNGVTAKCLLWLIGSAFESTNGNYDVTPSGSGSITNTWFIGNGLSAGYFTNEMFGSSGFPAISVGTLEGTWSNRHTFVNCNPWLIDCLATGISSGLVTIIGPARDSGTGQNGTMISSPVITGLPFPATPIASSDINTLDEYKEGTWTPVFNGTTIAGTFTYTIQSGTYTKIGSTVFFTFIIAISGISVAPTGNMRIAGLPYTALNDANKKGGVCFSIIENFKYSTNSLQLTASVLNNTTSIDLYESFSNSATVAVPASNFTNTGCALRGFGFYLATS